MCGLDLFFGSSKPVTWSVNTQDQWSMKFLLRRRSFQCYEQMDTSRWAASTRLLLIECMLNKKKSIYFVLTSVCEKQVLTFQCGVSTTHMHLINIKIHSNSKILKPVCIFTFLPFSYRCEMNDKVVLHAENNLISLN